MDTSKFKSVTVPIETWKLLKEIADRDMRSVSMVVAWLASQELTKPKKEKTNG